MRPLRTVLLFIIFTALGVGAGVWLTAHRSGSEQAAAASSEVTALRARMAALDGELTTARETIATLEKRLAAASAIQPAETPEPTTAATGPTDINTIFQQAKPLLQSLGPLFDNARRQRTKGMAERRVAELTEKYALTAEQQDAIKKWFEEKSEEEAAKGRELLNKPDAKLQDLLAAGRGQRPDDGLDALMATTLDPNQHAKYQADRLQERAANVEKEATRRVNRLNDIVTLDEAQQDQIFAIMARSSADYDPAMQLEGLGSDVASPADAASRDDAILAVLRPDQRAAYEADRQRRRDEAAKNLEAVGIKADLDAFEALGR